jgi:hypothetical protein
LGGLRLGVARKKKEDEKSAAASFRPGFAMEIMVDMIIIASIVPFFCPKMALWGACKP